MNRKSTSIQRQLQLFFVATLTLTVMIMGGVWISYNQVLLKEEAERVLIVESDMIGAAARPALMFNDQRMAGELLQAMQFDPDISIVKLFTYDGNELFTYNTAGVTVQVNHPSIEFQKQQSSSYNNGNLQIYRIIEHKDIPVGVIYLESSLNHLKESQYAGLITVIIVMLGCLMLGLLVASHLQRKIAAPISSLAQLMREMGSSQNYMLRAEEVVYNRETADLLRGFNQMAEKIQQSFETIEQNHVCLKESEARFRNIVELTPVPVVVSRRDGHVLFYNQASAKLFGMNAEVETPFNTGDFCRNPEARNRLLKKLQQKGELHGQELEVFNADGEMFWISLSMSTMPFEDELVLFSAFVDITDQKTVEQTLAKNNLALEQRVIERTEELQVAKNELQSTLDNMIVTYYRLRSDGTVKWTSASVYSLLGYQASEITGLTVQELLIDDDDEYSRLVERLKKHDSAVIKNMRLQMKHKLKHRIWVSLSIHFIFDEEGNCIGVEGVVHDVNEVVKAEEQRGEIEVKMAHVQRLESLGVLAGGIAHDFNNILAGMMGNAELAELNMQDYGLPKQKELTNILAGAHRAADLCKQMLAYSGQGGFIKNDLNITELVEEALQLIDISVSKNISLKLELSNILDPVLADKTQMQQIIMNLVTNAAESIGEEAVGHIVISTRLIEADNQDLECRYIDGKCKPGPYMLLEVVDDGCGMNAETQRKMFEPFYTTKFTGRGLGMSAVLGIVRSHSGVIQVRSTVGEGSSFRVLLPISNVAANEGIEICKKSSYHSDLSVTVLLIEDEMMVSAVAERLLQRIGCKVILAADGLQGIEAYQQHKDEITLVLLDMMMPIMGGKETLTRLREMDATLPIFICSGYSTDKVSSQFNREQPNGILQKPFTFKLLSELLEDNMNNHA